MDISHSKFAGLRWDGCDLFCLKVCVYVYFYSVHVCVWIVCACDYLYFCVSSQKCCVYLSVCMNVSVCVLVCACVCMHIVHSFMYVCMRVCAHCMYVCVCVWYRWTSWRGMHSAESMWSSATATVADRESKFPSFCALGVTVVMWQLGWGLASPLSQ